jgi:hypothetical protein
MEGRTNRGPPQKANRECEKSDRASIREKQNGRLAPPVISAIAN